MVRQKKPSSLWREPTVVAATIAFAGALLTSPLWVSWVSKERKLSPEQVAALAKWNDATARIESTLRDYVTRATPEVRARLRAGESRDLVLKEMEQALRDELHRPDKAAALAANEALRDAFPTLKLAGRTLDSILQARREEFHVLRTAIFNCMLSSDTPFLVPECDAAMERYRTGRISFANDVRHAALQQ